MRQRLRQALPLLAIGSFFLLQWFILFNPSPGVWDGAFYYAFARSPIFDQDLDLTNDFILSYPTSAPDFAAKGVENERTVTGRVASPFAIGSPLLWVPWLGIARLSQLGQTVTGYEWGFVGPTAVFSSFLALAAFYLAYQLAKTETSQTAALIATLTLMLTTPLLYYQFREPLYSHATAAFTNSLCIYIWWREWGARGDWRQAVKLGGLIGLATLVRWQYLLYLLLPGLSTLFWLWQASNRKETLWASVRHLFLVGLAALVVISPQLAIWQLFYGSWITVPQGGAYVDWSAPNILLTLFSPFRGLSAWMPIAIPALMGLLLLLRKRPQLATGLLLLFLLEVYINGSTADWFAGGGYGSRRYTGELLVFVVGYAVFVQALAPRWRWPIGGGLGILLALQQLVLLRYGLSDRLGGRVRSMYPRYEWEQVSWGEFLASLWERLPTAVSDLQTFFIYPHAPLEQLVAGQFPSVHVGSLLITAVYLLLLYLLWRLIKQHLPSTTLVWLMLVGIALLNLWILTAA